MNDREIIARVLRKNQGLNPRGEQFVQLPNLVVVSTALLLHCELVLRSQLLGPALKLKALDRKRLTSRSGPARRECAAPAPCPWA